MKSTVLFLAFAAAVSVAHAAAVAAPVVPFARQAPPPAPDYAKATSWAARPSREGAGGAVAPGATPAALKAKVDVFYVNPTTYRSKDHWNQDIIDAEVNKWTDESVVARQAGPFNGCCRVFAPRYRQASTLSLSQMAGDGGKAFDLAYSDVVRAFEYYLRHDNHGRPFIIVGHSQGGFHVARLLEEKIDGTPLAKQLVAGYALGYNLSVGDFGKTYKTLPICATPAQTGCVVGWNSVLSEAATADARASGERRYVQRYGDDAGKTMLCVNPLTFDLGKPAASAEQSLGVAPGDPGFGPLKPLVAKAVSARCESGQLIIEPVGDLGLKPLPGGSMHFHDIGLFYADIRANAVLRSRAWLKAHTKER